MHQDFDNFDGLSVTWLHSLSHNEFERLKVLPLSHMLTERGATHEQYIFLNAYMSLHITCFTWLETTTF